MSMTAIQPDGYLAPGSKEVDTAKHPWDAIDPCPKCDSKPEQSPEGVNLDGSPRWQAAHCWKCGFRPEINTAVNMADLRTQFTAFQAFQADNMPSHPSLLPPSSDSDTQFLKERLAALEAEMKANAVPASTAVATVQPSESDLAYQLAEAQATIAAMKSQQGS